MLHPTSLDASSISVYLQGLNVPMARIVFSSLKIASSFVLARTVAAAMNIVAHAIANFPVMLTYGLIGLDLHLRVNGSQGLT